MDTRIQVIPGDITKQSVDAIVNAANTSLLGGAGVDGAIHRAAGPDLLDECRRLHGCKTGEAKLTGGYSLPARWIIHTVGPVWQGGSASEDEQLASCYRNCFALARQHGIGTLAFPAISTGRYAFPVERAAQIALAETRRALEDDPALEKIVFVCFEERVYTAYLEALSRENSSAL